MDCQDKCELLKTKMDLLHSTLQGQSDRLVGTEIQEAVDQIKKYVNFTLCRLVLTQMMQYS